MRVLLEFLAVVSDLVPDCDTFFHSVPQEPSKVSFYHTIGNKLGCPKSPPVIARQKGTFSEGRSVE